MQINNPDGEYTDVVDHRLLTEAITKDKLTKAILDGDGFIWVFTGYDYDAADTVFFLRNDDQEKLLVISGINLYCDTATKIQIHSPDNPTAAGTAISGRRLNRVGTKTPNATAIQDETGNTQGTILMNKYIAANEEKELLQGGEIIVLRLNQCIGVDLVTIGTMAYGHIIGYYI